MDSPKQEKTWQARNELQKLVDGAGLCDRDSRGKAVPWKDASGSGASVGLLKAVLNALLTFYPNMHPSEELLSARTGKAVRTIQRAIQVLVAKEVLLVEDGGPQHRGGRVNRYTILGTRLKQLAPQQGTLWNQRPPAMRRTTTRHGAHDHPPCGARPPATDGALTIEPRTREELNQEGEGRRGGIVLGEKRGEVLQLAHRVRQVTGPLSQEQADEVIQACLWTVEGRLSEHSFEISLESTLRAKPRNAFRYWKTCIGNQLREVAAS